MLDDLLSDDDDDLGGGEGGGDDISSGDEGLTESVYGCLECNVKVNESTCPKCDSDLSESLLYEKKVEAKIEDEPAKVEEAEINEANKCCGCPKCKCKDGKCNPDCTCDKSNPCLTKSK